MKYFLKINLIIVLSLFFYGCDSNDVSPSVQNSETGQGGSLSRFTIIDQYMYYVDDNSLQVFDVSNEVNPELLHKNYTSFSDIETVYGFGDYLYLGSSTGMYIYSILQPDEPRFLSRTSHVRGCDPVVADETHSFVTIRNSSTCGWGNTLNVLQIYDVKKPEDPQLVSQTDLIEPIGLALKDQHLFVCDYDGINIFDVTDRTAPVLIKTIPSRAFDIIIDDDNVLTVDDKGVNQYSLIEDPVDLIFKSTIKSK